MMNRLEEYDQIAQVPTEYDKRHCTDRCCTIFGVAFSAIMFIIAIFTFDKGLYLQTNFPADTNGRLCGIDLPGYNYIYFTQAPNMGQRVCVSKCPSQNDPELSCVPTDSIGCRFSNSSGFEVQYIDTYPEQTKTGFYCYPTDEELKSQLLQNTNLKHWDNTIHSLNIMLIACFIALGLSIVYLLLVQYLPTIMDFFTIIAGILIMVVVAICLIFYSTDYVLSKWLIFIVILFLIIVTVKTVFLNRNNWAVHKIFLRRSTDTVMQRPYLFSYIPIFILLTALFLFIMVLTFTSYWGTGYSTFDPEKSLFHQLHGAFAKFMTVLWFIQLLWGLAFLKEAFNFVVSCVTVHWYYDKDEGCVYPWQLLTVKHFGSVIAAAFMTSFFSVLDYIFDFITPNVQQNPDSCYTTCFQACCNPCLKIFELVRSDALAFVNLSGNPYCNSSRYCEYLCDKSLLFDGSQATSRTYRICAHLLIASLVILISMYLDGDLSIGFGLLILGLSIFISTYFISIHADIAESILIIFLEDEQFLKRTKNNNVDYNKVEDFDYQMSKKQDIADELKNMRIAQKKKEQMAKQEAAKNEKDSSSSSNKDKQENKR